MKKIVLIMPMLILISGCANTRTYWVHNSKPQQYTYRDIADCEVSANSGSSYSYRGDDEVLHAINEWQSIDRRTSIFNNCMMGKGYYKVTEHTKKRQMKQKFIYQKEEEEKRKRKQKIYIQTDKNSCDAMPYDEYIKHPSCNKNYKDLDDFPLNSLESQSGKTCDEMSYEQWTKQPECMDNYRDLD